MTKIRDSVSVEILHYYTALSGHLATTVTFDLWPWKSSQ